MKKQIICDYILLECIGFSFAINRRGLIILTRHNFQRMLFSSRKVWLFQKLEQIYPILSAHW